MPGGRVAILKHLSSQYSIIIYCNRANILGVASHKFGVASHKWRVTGNQRLRVTKCAGNSIVGGISVEVTLIGTNKKRKQENWRDQTHSGVPGRIRPSVKYDRIGQGNFCTNDPLGILINL